MSVYVVVITSKTTGESKVGAVYETMLAANAECQRLNRANSFTKAYAVRRQVG